MVVSSCVFVIVKSRLSWKCTKGIATLMGASTLADDEV